MIKTLVPLCYYAGMERVSIKILEPKARRILDDLESLKLIEIEEADKTNAPKRRFGSMKGFVTFISDDFDAPLDDMNDHM